MRWWGVVLGFTPLSQLVQFPQSAVGVERGRGQGFGEAEGIGFAEVELGRAVAAKNRQVLFQCDDFPPGAALRRIGPPPDVFVEVEEDRHYGLDVLPVSGVVGLNHEQPARS